ncbi:MAG: phage anti-repressor protein [Neolewinella sp.]|jgi:phage anti-repressor protein
MELTIHISKKGTRVVKATELHRSLGLLDHHYQDNIRRWIKDIYQFGDGIRKPEGLRDFARHPNSRGKLIQEYWLAVEFAKLIALGSRSKVKQPIATKLSKEEDIYPEHVKLSATQTLELLEQTKALARISCQKAAESRHLAYYQVKRGNAEYWNHFRREQVVLTTIADLKEELNRRESKVPARADLRDLLQRVNPYELIRIGIVDHYAALGNSIPYAQQLGSLAQELARQLRLEIVDDRKGDLLFAPVADAEVVRKMQRVAA